MASDLITTDSDSAGLHLHVHLQDWLQQNFAPADDNAFSNPIQHGLHESFNTAMTLLFTTLHVPDHVDDPPPFPILLPNVGTGSAPSATFSPQDILKQIVDAINAAEQTLNSQNFIIASGSVQAQLNLPGLSGTINFNIAPKPYS